MEDIIREFWKCSLKSDFADFDWHEAFGEFEPYLTRKLTEHGLTSFEEFLEDYDDTFGLHVMESDVMNLHWAIAQNDYVQFSDVDVVRAIMKAKFEAFQDAFSGLHSELVDLGERLEKWTRLNESEKISLFDECIHAQHATGDILEDVDIESLREEAEQEYADEQERFPTNMREFLV